MNSKSPKWKKSCLCTQDIKIVMPPAVSCTVRGQAAVPASVCDLGSRDLEETAMRQNLVMPVRHQQLSILQPFNLRYRITWEIVKGLKKIVPKHRDYLDWNLQ